MKIDPWSNEGVQNYKEICEKFGLEIVDHTKLPNPTHLHRRGIIFAHRDLDNILEAKKAGRPFGVLSGLMPSGQIHLGHKMVIDQARWYQELGGDVTITVADLEAHATRGLSLEACRKCAIEEYGAWIRAKHQSISNQKGLLSRNWVSHWARKQIYPRWKQSTVLRGKQP